MDAAMMVATWPIPLSGWEGRMIDGISYSTSVVI